MKRNVAVLIIALILAAAAGYPGARAAGGPANVRVFALPETAGTIPHRKTGNPHWYYTIRFQETGGAGLEVDKVRRYVRLGGALALDAEYDAGTIAGWFGSARIGPYGLLDFSSGRPAQEGIQGETWEIEGRDGGGNSVLASGSVSFSLSPPAEPPEAPEHDTQILRRRAD